MKMRRNKFVPMNSLKKTKVQFSTRLSCCLGEHQAQEFFERVNITRQSGICSKNKNNSFGDKRSNSFRQTLELNVPFVADFSDSKQFCICYPVHFFRKKFHSYDAEDNRLASVRVYFPASRMKYGNDFKISPDFKKRLHLCPYQFEFVAYSSLLTLSLEDLSLAVFRAKSSSEKFKIANSLAIPKLLISQNNSNSQTGTPIFIGTERIYSRILKLISCSQSEGFKLNSTSAINLESSLHLKKCILKWIGVEDFLPPSSRIIFVRRVSSDSGDTLGASILNSPGPKIKKSRLRENERLSIRLKQIKLENFEECEEDSKDNIYSEESMTETVKLISFDPQDNKRPRGRPKKLLCTANVISSETPVLDDISSNKNVDTEKVIVDKLKCESLQLKSESTSNSMTDSTSEEKYSVQLSSCTTPDTHKSCSPVILNGTVTNSLSSSSSILQPSTTVSNSKAVKNRRGRPRKYPISLKAEQTVFKCQKGFTDFHQSAKNSEDGSLKIRKRSNTDVRKDSSNKLFRSSNSSISSVDGNISKMQTPRLESPNNFPVANEKMCSNVHSIWRPLKQPLPAPSPAVPFINQLSNTGLCTDRKLKSTFDHMKNQFDTLNKDAIHQLNLSDLPTQKFNIDSISENLCKPLSNQFNGKRASVLTPNSHIRGISPTKSMLKDTNLYPSNNNQYLLQNSGYNALMVHPSMSPYTFNNGLMPPFMSNIFQTNNASFSSSQSPIMNTLASLFSPINTPNPLKIQPMSVSPSLFYDNSCRQLYPSNHFAATDIPIPSAISQNCQQSFQNQQYSQILLASKYDSLYPNMSWSGDYPWKY